MSGNKVRQCVVHPAAMRWVGHPSNATGKFIGAATLCVGFLARVNQLHSSRNYIAHTVYVCTSSLRHEGGHYRQMQSRRCQGINTARPESPDFLRDGCGEHIVMQVRHAGN